MVDFSPIKRQPLRLGVICRGDQSGLGSMSIDFCRHLSWCVGIQPAKILLIDVGKGETDPGWFHQDVPMVRTNGRFHSSVLAEFVTGLDWLVSFETFYHDEAVAICVQRGVKTAIVAMHECSPPEIGAADLIICPTDAECRRWPIDNFPSRLIPWPCSPIDFPPAPVDTSEYQTPDRRMYDGPIRFVCNAGYGGLHDRNNVGLVLHAADWANRSDNRIKIAVRSFNLDPQQQYRGAVICYPKKTRPELYQNVDCLIHLQGIEGLSLPLLEAARCRVPTLVMERPGTDDYPKQMRIPAGCIDHCQIGGRLIPYYRPHVVHLVGTILEIAHQKRKLQPGPVPTDWPKFFYQFFQALGSAPKCFT